LTWLRSGGALAVATAALAAAHAVILYRGFIEDDAYISFRYAQRLTDGHWLTWSSGTPAEGYSDLLWVLLVAPAGWFGPYHLELARLIGLVGLVVGVVAVGLVPGNRQPEPRRAGSVGLTLALTGALPVWAMGGLEHTFLAGLVAVTLHALIAYAERGRAGALASGGLAAIALTRIDGFVLVAGMLAGAAWVTRTARP
jgi:hypothetical protein